MVGSNETEARPWGIGQAAAQAWAQGPLSSAQSCVVLGARACPQQEERGTKQGASRGRAGLGGRQPWGAGLGAPQGWKGAGSETQVALEAEMLENWNCSQGLLHPGLRELQPPEVSWPLLPAGSLMLVFPCAPLGNQFW